MLTPFVLSVPNVQTLSPPGTARCDKINARSVTVSLDWREDTLKAESWWLQALSVPVRIDLLCLFLDFILAQKDRDTYQCCPCCELLKI